MFEEQVVLTLTIPEILGRRIVEERKRLGLTQEALANKAKISRASLALVEMGRGNIQLETLVRVAEALEVHPSELLRLTTKN